ncbi:MAG: DUF4369 domain-containing protein [Odoribacter sp.]|nr:DUF4369 domain-containing protein [Odoribacter sp.]
MNCKKLFQLGVVGCLLAACTPNLAENEYLLRGSIDGRDGEEIYLMYNDENNNMLIDTAVITKGKFEFGGMLNKPIRTATLCMGNLQNWNNPDRCTLYIEPHLMTVTIGAEGFNAAKVTGSYTQSEADTLKQQCAQYYDQLIAINQQMATAKGDERAALEAKMRPLREKYDAVEMNFVKTHPNSFITPEKLRFRMGGMEYKEIKALYDGFSDRVKRYGDVKEIEKELAALERVQPGKTAPYIKK